MTPASLALSKLKIDTGTALEFFAVFSRFEYSLKATGFLRVRAGIAEADWDSFALSIKENFDPNSTDELAKVIEYFYSEPPRTLAFQNNHLYWRNIAPNPNLSVIENLLKMVRRVRNNLFHGGKFLSTLNDDKLRDEKLVMGSVVILLACLPHNYLVERAFQW